MAKKKGILDKIEPHEAKAVLRELAKDRNIRKKAEEIALAMVSDVDVDEVAELVFWELDAIPVEKVWDNSGSTRDGYVEPGDYAWQLFEDALDPFIQQTRRLRELSLHDQAKLHTMGILKGIHRFETDSESEFKDWAVDAPAELFERIYDDWKKGSRKKKDLKEMKNFIMEHCPGTGKI
ncbi:MAG: hypothetical protein ABIJ56_21630 [Pseudomonadota bacterium]